MWSKEEAERMALLKKLDAAERWQAAAGPPPIPSDPRYRRPTAVSPGKRPTEPPRPPKSSKPKPPRDVEDDLIGTWLPRLGVVALVLGAGFGYKLAVDRGMIGPLARVALGMAAGVGLLFIGEWTRRRNWHRYAQAVTAGGLGLLTLVVWAAHHRYELLGAPEAFALFAGIAVTGGFLAVVNDSEALAILATIVGFLDPVMVGTDASTASLAGYIFVLDAGVLVLAARRRWRTLPWLAAAGSWILFGLVANRATVPTAIAYGTEIFVLFTAIPFVAALTKKEPVAESDVALAYLTAFVYYVSTMALLNQGYLDVRAPFTAALGIVFAALAFAARRKGEEQLAIGEGAIAFLLCAAAVPMGLTGAAIGFVWTLEAVILFVMADRHESSVIRTLGTGLLAVAIADAVLVVFAVGESYLPARLLISFESLTLVTQIGALYVAAAAHRTRDRDLGTALWLMANILTLAWLGFEAHAYLRPREDTLEGLQLQSLTYSGIAGLYAGLLMTIGVVRQHRGARTFALVLFAGTIVKMAVSDLWLLSTAYRTIGFIGLGVVLLSCSLLYHRFRGLVTNVNGPADEVGATREVAV